MILYRSVISSESEDIYCLFNYILYNKTLVNKINFNFIGWLKSTIMQSYIFLNGTPYIFEFILEFYVFFSSMSYFQNKYPA